PFAAASVLLAGLRSFYVDQAFQLQGRTGLQAWALGIGAALNVGLNLWWIPTHGVYGAAAATVLAYLVALGASWVLSRRAFALPVPLAEIAGVAAGCTIMASALQLWPWSGGAAQVLGQVLWGASVYAATLLVIDYAGVRTYLRKGWLRLRSANQ